MKVAPMPIAAAWYAYRESGSTLPVSLAALIFFIGAAAPRLLSKLIFPERAERWDLHLRLFGTVAAGALAVLVALTVAL